MANAIEKYDPISALSAICLFIDTVARNTTETAPELAKVICTMVTVVNTDLGVY